MRHFQVLTSTNNETTKDTMVSINCNDSRDSLLALLPAVVAMFSMFDVCGCPSVGSMITIFHLLLNIAQAFHVDLGHVVLEKIKINEKKYDIKHCKVCLMSLTSSNKELD